MQLVTLLSLCRHHAKLVTAMPERYKRCSTRLTRYVLSTALPLLAAAAQQRHTRRVLRFFWQCKFKPVGRLDRGLDAVDARDRVHVLHKNPLLS